MLPLSTALQTELTDDAEIATYRGELSDTWKVGSQVFSPGISPHILTKPSTESRKEARYALGAALDACIAHQTATPHPDLIHVTAHFLHASHVGAVEVRIQTLKRGRGFTNLSADIIQQARRLPLPNHLSLAAPDPMRAEWAFQNHLRWAWDKDILARNGPDNAARTDSSTVSGGGVDWGAWCELTSEDDRIVTSSVPFFGDTFQHLPSLLPESEKASHGAGYPAMTMAVEFKARIPPSSSPHHSTRTVGLYCESRFLGDPQGRHNARVEVWTAPSGIGQDKAADGWRDRQYCIAVVDQMALTVPMDVNRRQGTRDGAKL
ncbi:hypothetical protein BJ138DRAFT_1120867 [Hygrophoropsis aurantiaca]|uniref:Uncharacterized protein n=1 Tax=Hygrophoropsis aurantiaca TaxID=72124 RepID=A0ACB7ZQ08_9AGAM|nr:hypothetical protein BJ138DRAFT_1120867 [Hygrophoropsis aurantiaca]